MLVHKALIRNINRQYEIRNNVITRSTPEITLKGPVYEEIELTDKSSDINFSQNVAYECTK